jgi:hypothetical protein
MKAQMFNLYTIETVLLSTIETLFLNRKNISLRLYYVLQKKVKTCIEMRVI